MIAARRAERSGEPLAAAASASATGRVRYRFARDGERGLLFEREIVTADDTTPFRLTTTLDALARGRVEGPAVAASQDDMAVELALGSQRRGRLDEATLRRIAGPLERCSDITLDGQPVRVTDEAVRPIVVVEDAPGGFRVRLAEPTGIEERFSGGFVLVNGALRPIGASRLTGRELHDLDPGKTFAFEDAARIVTEWLPTLEDRLEIDVRTDRLPETTRSERPRIEIDTQRRGDRLSVLATLVYGDPPVARVDGGKLVHLSGRIPVRDREAEARAVAKLRDTLGLAPGHRVDLAPDAAIAFASDSATWHGAITGDGVSDFELRGSLRARLEVSGSRLALTFEGGGEGEGPEGGGANARTASADAVLAAWRDGASVVGLEGGGFAPLPADWLERYGALVADLLAARDTQGEVAACALPDLARLCDALDEPPPPAFEKLRPLIEGFEGLPEAPLPDDLTATLRDYQRRGVDWLWFLRDASLGALLADDMGLGKTLQTLCAVPEGGRTLVVAPTSVLGNWRDEAQRFRPSLRVATYHGAARELDPEADLTLTSYALLRLDAEALQAVEWDCCVLDEAQMIKNPESQVAQAAYGLRAKQRIALTGTPVENRLDELWSQFHFLNRGLLGGRSDFRERYARPIGAGDGAAAERLRERVRPFLLRRLKRDVARELPPRTDVVLRFALSDEERSAYDAVRAAGLDEAVRALRSGGSLMPALEVLLRLRQAACHTGLVPGAREGIASSKLELLVSRLEQARDDGHRALVFSQWTKLLDRVEPELERAGIGFLRLDGSTRDRSGVVSRFQSQEEASGEHAAEFPVLLASLRAGGTGLNLTAADHVFLIDPWWNPAVEDQAADRAHRIGQTRPVVVHRLVAQDTVEERILALHESKRALAEAALGEGSDDVGGAGLTRDDLLAPARLTARAVRGGRL